MNEKDKLLAHLRMIEANDYRIEKDQDINNYVNLMLKYIGDADAELRDDYIYTTFYKWIYEDDLFSNAEIIDLLDILIDNDHLFYHIGNDNDDTVFTRAFSILIVALIIRKHRDKAFMSISEYDKVKEAVIRYYQKEKDFRGYTGEKGWAHAAAHGSDALLELALCEECTLEIYKEVLDSINVVIYNGRYTLCDQEDERISRIISRCVDKDKDINKRIIKWINDLDECLEWKNSRRLFITRVNVKSLLRCLYFRLMDNPKAQNINEAIYAMEKKLAKNQSSFIV